VGWVSFLAEGGSVFRRNQQRETVAGTVRPSDGFYLSGEMHVARARTGLPEHLVRAYADAVRAIAARVPYPVQYAGAGQWSVFPRPFRFSVDLSLIHI
jgi:hypothetical protein